MKLQKIFEDMRKNNIYPNLDDNYCTTSYMDNISLKNKGYKINKSLMINCLILSY